MAPESTPTHNFLSVEYISLGSLQPDPGNARLHDKRQAMNAQTARIESGHFLLPAEASWLADYRQELLAFPGSKYDDQVDATTQGLEWLAQYRPGIAGVLSTAGSGSPMRSYGRQWP